MLGFSVSKMLLVGVILLLLALLFSALSLQIETYDIELVADIPTGAEGSLIKLFNIDLGKSYSSAYLTLYNNGEDPVKIVVTHPTGVVSRYILDSSDEITIEILNLLSKLRIDSIDGNITNVHGVMKLTVVENKYAWLSIPGFVAFIVGTVLTSIGVMTYWMERGYKSK